MRAFKKLMAATIATAIAATLATSAFAAELSEGKMILSEGESYTPATTGQTTVLVVPYDAWVSGALTDLDDADILYIDQYANAAAATAAITEGLGVKLTNGELADINTTEGAADYYVLFGGNTNDGAFAITALECVIGEEAEGTFVLGDLTGDGEILAEDGTAMAKILAGMISLTEDLIKRANVDTADGILTGEASITAADGTAMAKYLAGMISSFN